MLWVILLGPPAVLAGLAVRCLRRLPRERRKGLMTACIATAAVAAALFGGSFVLGRFDLAWRSRPFCNMAVVMWLLFLTAGGLTVWYTTRCPAGGRAVTVLAALCFAWMLFVDSYFGMLCLGIGFYAEEQVGDYQGQTVVQVAQHWNHTDYRLYAYHGPLVRGNKALAWATDKRFLAKPQE